ncbi:hypothetical protein KC19_7G091500 [Ceratodon purpureus]|uniref:Uncharacterized protein n=1 Tax=Ceratodon purpureus TaxID=3225 RepID=A0A8T0H847_CERPU|nr:hypothetical protein KC19_7G091500 [Ceratodon purpureus]
MKTMSAAASFTRHPTKLLILDEAFHMMVDYKSTRGKYPPSFEAMIAFLTKVGANRQMFFSGLLDHKPAADLVIADFSDGLYVPGVSEYPEHVPLWNEVVKDYIKLTVGFSRGFLHDDGALLFFIPDSSHITKVLASFLKNNNLVVKKEWIIVNSLHHTHPMDPARLFDFAVDV